MSSKLTIELKNRQFRFSAVFSIKKSRKREMGVNKWRTYYTVNNNLEGSFYIAVQNI